MVPRVRSAVGTAEMALVVTGMGGATGTYVAPLLAERLQESELLTVVVGVEPFRFEGRLRSRRCAEALGRCAGVCDAVWSVPNDTLKEVEENVAFGLYFEECNREIRARVRALARIVSGGGGLLGFDRGVLVSSLRSAGAISVGVARAEGDGDAGEVLARAAAVACGPLGGLQTAQKLFVHIAGGEAFPLREVRCAGEAAREMAPDSDVHFGVSASCEATAGGEVAVLAVSRRSERRATPGVPGPDEADEPPSVFAGHAPAMYDGQNLDIPTFRRRKIFRR
jgi:cell division GTPase FtsZ